MQVICRGHDIDFHINVGVLVKRFSKERVFATAQQVAQTFLLGQFLNNIPLWVVANNCDYRAPKARQFAVGIPFLEIGEMSVKREMPDNRKHQWSGPVDNDMKMTAVVGSVNTFFCQLIQNVVTGNVPILYDDRPEGFTVFPCQIFKRILFHNKSSFL
jgi:hypothetical protein